MAERTQKANKLSINSFLNDSVTSAYDSKPTTLLREVSECYRMATYDLKKVPRNPLSKKELRRHNQSVLLGDMKESVRDILVQTLINEQKADIVNAVYKDEASGMSTRVDAIEILGDPFGKNPDVFVMFLDFPTYDKFKAMSEEEFQLTPQQRRSILLSSEIIARNGYNVVEAALWHISILGGNHHTIFNRMFQSLITFDNSVRKEAKDEYWTWVSNYDDFKKDGSLSVPLDDVDKKICDVCSYNKVCRYGKVALADGQLSLVK